MRQEEQIKAISGLRVLSVLAVIAVIRRESALEIVLSVFCRYTGGSGVGRAFHGSPQPGQGSPALW